MKRLFKKYSASVLALVTVFCVLAQVTVFAKTGTVVTNTGVRHVVCAELSNQAEDYYKDNNAVFETVYKLKGGSGNCLTTVDSALFDELHDLMSETMTKTVDYDDLPSYWVMTDANNGGSTYHYFYADVTVSGQTINREHVWPKSHASFHEKDGGADPHHLRPTIQGVNSSRGDKVMGNVTSATKKYSFQNKVVLEHSNALVEVNDNIKGDVARILLYVYCRWEEPNLFMDTPDPVVGSGSKNSNDGEKVIESLDTLLQWCKLDPVDTWEMARNDQCENLVGNRNVFIDYPEYAWLLFGQKVPADLTTPSGQAKKIAAQGGNQGSNQGGSTSSDNSSSNNSSTDSTISDGNSSIDDGVQGGIDDKPQNEGKPYDPNNIGGQNVQNDNSPSIEPWLIIAIVAGVIIAVAVTVTVIIVVKKRKK